MTNIDTNLLYILYTVGASAAWGVNFGLAIAFYEGGHRKFSYFLAGSSLVTVILIVNLVKGLVNMVGGC